jgi:hypothetical protein
MIDISSTNKSIIQARTSRRKKEKTLAERESHDLSLADIFGPHYKLVLLSIDFCSIYLQNRKSKLYCLFFV